MQPKQKRRKHLLEDSYKLCPLKGIISFQRLFLFSSSKIFHHLLFTSCNRIRGSPQTIFMVPKLEAVFSHFSSPRLMIQPELIRAQSRWDHKQNRSLDPSRSRPAAHRPTDQQAEAKVRRAGPSLSKQKQQDLCLVLGKCRIKNPLSLSNLFTVLTGDCLLPLFTISPFKATFTFCYSKCCFHENVKINTTTNTEKGEEIKSKFRNEIKTKIDKLNEITWNHHFSAKRFFLHKFNHIIQINWYLYELFIYIIHESVGIIISFVDYRIISEKYWKDVIDEDL